MGSVVPLSQKDRQQCSLPLADADLSLGNANWMKGLQSMSDWIWSGQLNPVAFPNNLARYFLQIPAIFEQQLNFSTTLIFDEPSFRNGIQISGFLDRVSRELVISLIAQRRHCWYSMTHHAVLGYFTAKKHGLSDRTFAAKWSVLTEHETNQRVYSDVERAVLRFADAFATNPKSYSDDGYENLRTVLGQDNETRYLENGLWMARLNAAREARSLALANGGSVADIDQAAASAASGVDQQLPAAVKERLINAQVVELAFLCLQFVALTDVLSGLNIPDESFLTDVMRQLLPDDVIEKINELNQLGGKDMPDLVPPPVKLPLDEILAGKVTVDPAPLKGSRIPLQPYETNMANDLDKGLTVGGVQIGVYGWSFGFHFPGSLVYALALHPELARYEAPYSLPLLFNEDEWRNGTQTGGYVPRLLKELVYQKIYQTTRSRYGLEHHTMFLYNSYLDLYGVNRPPHPKMIPKLQDKARKSALDRAGKAVLYMLQHESAPLGVYTELEKAALTWTHRMITMPHAAYEAEPRLREELDSQNRREVAAGLRRFDMSPGLGEDAAYKRLEDHQIAELAMLIGHMDGLGRALTMLRLESEESVQVVEGELNPATGGIKPVLVKGEVKLTGYFNNRQGLLQTLPAIGVSKPALTLNELLVNPILNDEITSRLNKGERNIVIDSLQAARSGEF